VSSICEASTGTVVVRSAARGAAGRRCLKRSECLVGCCGVFQSGLLAFDEFDGCGVAHCDNETACANGTVAAVCLCLIYVNLPLLQWVAIIRPVKSLI